MSCSRNLCWGERVLGKGARKDFGSARCTGLEEERGGLAEASDSNVARDEESSRSNFAEVEGVRKYVVMGKSSGWQFKGGRVVRSKNKLFWIKEMGRIAHAGQS